MPFGFQDRFKPKPDTFDFRFSPTTGTIYTMPTLHVGQVEKVWIFTTELSSLTACSNSEVSNSDLVIYRTQVNIA